MNSTKQKIEKGSKVPSFTLKDQDGKLFDIQSVLGKKNLVIYFYPKDDSPGCTKEACYFRDQFEVFNQADAMIIGISGQSVESHKKFAEKYHLSFTLLSDEGNQGSESYSEFRPICSACLAGKGYLCSGQNRNGGVCV